MSGDERRAILWAWALIAGLIVAFCVVNILTIRHDSPDLGPLLPVIWEVSSALVTLVILAIPAGVALWTHRTRPLWWKAAPVHVAAAITYSALHVAGFVILRKIAHAALGQYPYEFGDLFEEFPYELRKDMMAYGLASLIYGFSLRPGGRPAVSAETPAPSPATFDIQDGARLVRVPIDEILAVRSAGNYVEFLLADSRRPLMRTPLATVQGDLAIHGFVRSHRSWLVNRAKVTGLKPEGSGDYTVELGDLQAPLSRRFPDALTALRG